MGIRTGIRVVKHPAQVRENHIKLADDFQVRVDCAPSGLAKFAIVAAIMRSYGRYPLWTGCQFVNECNLVLKNYMKFQNLLVRQRERKGG